MKKKLKLHNVTLLAATSVDIDQTQLALKISMHNIEFGAIKFCLYVVRYGLGRG